MTVGGDIRCLFSAASGAQALHATEALGPKVQTPYGTVQGIDRLDQGGDDRPLGLCRGQARDGKG